MYALINGAQILIYRSLPAAKLKKSVKSGLFMTETMISLLEDGRITERGTHEQLIEERGKYYQLYTGAFELE